MGNYNVTDTGDEIARLAQLLQSNPAAVYNDSSVSPADIATLINFNVTAAPTNPTNAFILSMLLGDNDYAPSGPPVVSLTEATGLAAGEEYELTDSVDGLQAGCLSTSRPLIF